MEFILSHEHYCLVEHKGKLYRRSTASGRRSGFDWRMVCFVRIIPERRMESTKSWIRRNPERIIHGLDGMSYFIYNAMINRDEGEIIKWSSSRDTKKGLSDELEALFQKDIAPIFFQSLVDWHENIAIPETVCGIPATQE